MPPVSAPAPPRSQVATLIEAPPKIDKSPCPKCGVEAKPYSRFCESCGFGLDAPDTGKLKTPPATGSLRTQSERPSTLMRTSQLEASSQPTLIDQPPYKSLPPDHLFIGRDKSALSRDSKGKPDALRPTFQRPTNSEVETTPLSPAQAAAELLHVGDPAHVVRLEGVVPPPPIKSPEPLPKLPHRLPGIKQRQTRAAYQALALIGAALVVTIILTAWYLWRLKVPRVESVAKQQVTTESISTAVMSSPTPAPSVTSPPEGMVYVPGGTFLIGRGDGDKFESPSSTVPIQPFFIDRTEVTNEEYQQFVKATGHPAPPNWSKGRFPEGRAKFPVVNVSWSDAVAYADWAQKRLPTEAEWEYAARGADGRTYPWGNVWNPDYANADRGPKGQIVPVGAYSSGASPFDLLDMCGNVWEWTSSELVSYVDKNKKLVPSKLKVKVIRGGAYDAPRGYATTTYRGYLPQNKVGGYDKTGFRCVRSVN